MSSTLVLESSLKGARSTCRRRSAKSAARDDSAARRAARGQRPSGRGHRRSVSYGRALQVGGASPAAGQRHAASTARSWCSGAPPGEPRRSRAERPGIWVRGELPVLNVDDWLALARSRRCLGGRRRPAMTMPSRSAASTSTSARSRCSAAASTISRSPRAARTRTGSSSCAAATSPAPPPGRRPAATRRTDASSRACRASRCRPRASCRRGAARTSRRTTKAASGADRPVAGARHRRRQLRVEGPRSRASSSSSRSRAAPSGGSRSSRCRTTPAGSTPTARGADSGRQQQTKLDVALDVKDAGAFLARFGYPDAIKGAPTKIRGQLAWAGSPAEFDYPTLAGALTVDGRARAASRRSSPGSASCSACCRCSRCRGASRSISRTSSARASRSTRSPATSASPTA